MELGESAVEHSLPPIPLPKVLQSVLLDATAARGCRYNIINSGFSDAVLPACNGDRPDQIELQRRPETSTTAQWLEHARQMGRKFVHPLVMLQRDYQVPGTCLVDSVFTIWTDNQGRLWSLIFNDEEGRRDIRIYLVGDPEKDQWWKYCQAATVPANSEEHKPASE